MRIRTFLRASLFFILFIVCTAVPTQAETAESLKAHFIDVGFGDATLLQLPDGRTMMVDAGEALYGEQLVSYLKEAGIEKIDIAVITHPHKNHFEGFFNIAETLPIGQVYINGDERTDGDYSGLLDEFKKKNIPVQTLKRGDRISGVPQSVEIRVLHPPDLSGSINDNSIILHLTFKEESMLLMADAEEKLQDELITAFPEVLDAKYIKIPHHGGPLSDMFLRSFTDKSFIISTGKNPWGLPRESDLKRLQGHVARTDESGTILLTIESSEKTIKKKSP